MKKQKRKWKLISEKKLTFSRVIYNFWKTGNEDRYRAISSWQTNIRTHSLTYLLTYYFERKRVINKDICVFGVDYTMLWCVIKPYLFISFNFTFSLKYQYNFTTSLSIIYWQPQADCNKRIAIGSMFFYSCNSSAYIIHGELLLLLLPPL